MQCTPRVCAVVECECVCVCVCAREGGREEERKKGERKKDAGRKVAR